MNEELFVRVYKIGCGDCIFIRVPDTDRPYHILIDCGNFFGDKSSDLKEAIRDVEKLLNDNTIVPEKRLGHLDLLVVTHQHLDHIKGFEVALETFKKIKIDRIWLTIGMKADHPDAQQLFALQDHVDKTISWLKKDPNIRLNSSLNSLLMMMSLSTKEATEVLRNDLPSYHSIKPQYVYRGFEKKLTFKKRRENLINFKDPHIKLHVLAPEKKIDDSYMGNTFNFLETLNMEKNFLNDLIPENQRIEYPINISNREFRILKTQLRYPSLLAASQSNHIVNNTSVVLLLEWRGRRLLFPGDAEIESWTKMWENTDSELSKPVNFLKVSHHGSHNGTPYKLTYFNNSINQILDAILPKSNAKKAKAIVSTLAGRIHSVTNPVPLLDLMNELAKRVNNTKEYPPEVGKQPQRTDKEEDLDWIDATFKPMSGF